jgi:cytochrome P450
MLFSIPELLNPLRYADGSIHQIFRALPPVTWQQSFWAVTGYPEAQQVLSNPAVFSSAYGSGLSSDTKPGLVSLNLSDPPLHTDLRASVEAWLSRVKPEYRLGDHPIRELPRQTLQAIFEIDSQPARRLQRLAVGVARHQRSANAKLLQALEPIACPVSLAPVDQLYLKRLLTLASLESSSAALTSLARHTPEPEMLEEMLRLHPPIQRFGRHVLRDTQLGSEIVRAGQRVVVFFAAANRDPRVFKAPDEWRRRRVAHLSFGYGPHRCPGAQLARLQLRLARSNPGNPPERIYPSNFALSPWST